MPEPKCPIYWSKDGSSNLANLHWSDLPQEKTEITVSSFSCDSMEKYSNTFFLQQPVRRSEFFLILEKTIILNFFKQKETLNDEDIKVLLNEHRQLFSRIERLPKD